MGSDCPSRRRVSGYFPESGAIFMADSLTRKECFSRKLFGLPATFSDFVMEIKTGMILFLFDHQVKMLYGVFEAASDGAMNIEPHAYKSSGKRFPAQVRFSILWRCAPIPEHDFRDAINENYYARYKFNFGLTRSQVDRLVLLFDQRKVKTVTKVPQTIDQTKPNKPQTMVQKKKCVVNFEKIKSLIESPSKCVDKSKPRPKLKRENLASQVKLADDSEQLANVVPEKHPSSGSSDVADNTEPLANLIPDKHPSSGSLDVTDKSEPMTDLMPDKHPSLGSDGGSVTDLNDYIPLPSIDPEEMQSSLADELDVHEDIIPSINNERTKSLLPDGLSEGPDDQVLWNAVLSGANECVLQEEACPSVSQCNNTKQIVVTDNASEYQTRGLHSDNANERTSVFLRLSSVSRRKEENSQCDQTMDSSSRVLKQLNDRYKEWKEANACRTPPSNEAKVSKIKKKSVFARLNFKVVEAPEDGQRSASEFDGLSGFEEFRPQNLKRKASCIVNTLSEVEASVGKSKERSDCSTFKEEKKSRLTDNFIETTDESQSLHQSSTMSVPFQGSSEATVKGSWATQL